MSCECASLRMEVLSQKSELLSQRTLMIQWFETLMAELQDVKKQNSELKELFKASTRHQQESMVVNSEPSILEEFPVNGSLHTNENSVENVFECQPEYPQETSNPFIKSVEVALVETGFQLNELDQKIVSPEIEPAEVIPESPLQQLEQFESAAIDTQETLCTVANEDKSTGPRNKRSKTAHRAGIRSTKRQCASKGTKSITGKIGKLRCSKCPYLARKPSALKEHYLIHTDEKSFSCDLCDFRSSLATSLSRHRRTHTDEKPFQCSVCHKSFKSKCSLERHNLLHTGEKPFECTICNKFFARKEHIKIHNLTHTGEKLFDYPICSKSFSQKGHLVSHNLIHTGEKPFSCDICDYQCRERGSLLKHKRTHSGEKPFQCDMCDCRTAQRGNLLRHKKRIHRK